MRPSIMDGVRERITAWLEVQARPDGDRDPGSPPGGGSRSVPGPARANGPAVREAPPGGYGEGCSARKPSHADQDGAADPADLIAAKVIRERWVTFRIETTRGSFHGA